MRKPAQHVVMSFVSADDASAAVLMLHQLGLASTDVASYTSQQMRARAAAVLGRACPPPEMEPQLVITQRELARLGYSFVLARAGSATLLQRICRVAAEAHAYGVQATPPAGATKRRPTPTTASSAPTDRWRTAARPSTGP